MKLHCKKLGSGPPIIVLHGFLGTSDNWITIARALKDHYTVYLLDQRNHGYSSHSEVHTIEKMADDLDEFIGYQNIDHPVLIGHSMGGKVAMNYAARFENFKLLVIVDIAPKYYAPHHQQIFAGLNSLNLAEISSREAADRQLSDYVKEPGVRQFILKNLARSGDKYTWKANLPVLEEAMYHIGDGIEKVVVDRPTYFIRGERSDYILSEDREQIKTLFPLSKILTIKNAGHWVHAEQPEAFLRTINEILKVNLLL